MKTVNIGKNAPVSAIVLGCMRMAGLSADKRDNIINTAIECGINFFDHADIYGGGRSEELFGEYLSSHKELREKIKIQTKCAIRGGMYDFSKEHILESVDKSLSRLKCDYLDYLLLHRPDTLMEPEEVAEAFNILHKSGKVLHFGVSNHNSYQIEFLNRFLSQPIEIDQLQVSVTEAGLFTSGMNVNMKNDESVMHDGGLLEYCRLKDITIQAWSPLQYGFFDGNFVGNYEKFPELNKKLEETGEKYQISPSAVAIAWLLRHPAGIQTIVGTMNPQHLSDICKAGDITLTRREWYDIYNSAGHMLP